MANKHKGEVALEADGKAYTMRLSANALCELEGVLQRSAPEVFAGLGDVDFRSVRAIVWASLTESVPGITLAGAGTIIDAVGIKAVVVKIAELVKVTFPQDAGEASPENPQ
jgi:hypothetical protein